MCGELASAPESLRELERCGGADAVTARAARRKQHGSLLSWLDPRITADETRASQLEDCRRAEPFVPLYQAKPLSLSLSLSLPSFFLSNLSLFLSETRSLFGL